MKTLLILLTVFLFSFQQAPEKVYVCDSNTSIAYHKTDRCKGLNKCTHKIIYITVDEAKGKKKRACKICYPK